MFENTVVVHLLFTATCSHINSPVNQTPQAQLILLNNSQDE